MASKNVNRRLFIYINGKQVKNTLTGVRSQMRKVQGQLGHLTRGTEEYNKKSQELRKITKIYNEMKQEIKGIPSLLKRVKDELGLLGVSLLSIFSVNAMISYFKTLKQKVDVLRELKHTISQITELEGRELEMVTAKVKALADGFDEDAKKMTEAANNLSKQMSIDFTQALNLIEQGYIDGANANGDFLDKVREYPALLKEAGLSAKQAIKLMTQEVKKGIYSDKGVDAIKEANLRLREMTPAAKQALNAIGLSSKGIEDDLSSGRKTIFQVIQSISARLATLPPQSKLAGQAIADIFGGPGEDAGLQYLATLHEIDLSLNDLTDTTDDYAKAKQLEIEANESLNNVWVQLTGTASTLNLAWNKMKLQVAHAVSFFAKLVGISDDADGSLDDLREKIVTVTKVLLVGVSAFFSYNAAVRLMSIWTKIATGDTILHTLAVKANAAGMIVAKAATFAYITIVSLLTGNLKRATVAMRAFSIATKLNPIGLLIAAITAAVVAYQLFSKSTDEAAIKQRALNEVKKRSASIFGKEEAELKKLLAVAKNENLSKEERIKAIEKLNKLSPKYLGNLTLENINTREAADAIDKHVEAMKKRAEQKALEQLIDETIKKRREEEAKGLDEHTKWYDYLTTAITSFGNHTIASIQMTEKAVKRRKENIDELTAKENIYIEEYKKNLEEQTKADEKLLENDKKFKQIRASLERTALKLRIKNIENLSNEQLRVEIQKAIERNNKLAEVNKKNAERAAEERKKQLEKEAEYRDKIILGNKSLIEQEIAAHNNRLKQAGLFGKKREALTESELLALEALEFKHQANLAKIEIDATNKHLAEKKRKYESEKIERQIAFNNELAEINTLEEAKNALRDRLSEEELNKIDTLEKAKSALKREHEASELEKQAEYLQSLVNLFNTALNNGEVEGVTFADNILTDEQKELLNERLEEVRLKLSEIGLEKQKLSGGGEEEDVDLSSLDDVDIFGSSPEQWENAFSNLDTAKGKIEALGTVLRGLQSAWSMYSDFIAANEQKQLRTLEKSNNKKKDALRRQLDAGIIDQETYNREVEKLDNELARKKAEIEYKQAKREKIAALFGIVSNTALGVMKAVAASPLTGGLPWSAIIGAMGAAQAALVLAKPLPDRSYNKGGFTESLGYKDHTGEDVAGVVHADEYVVPKFVMNDTGDPAIPQIINYLEGKRLAKLGFNDGGHTSTPAPEFDEEQQTTTAVSDTDSALIEAINRLNNNLESGIEAYVVRSLESYLNEKEIDEEHEQLLNNTRQ